MLKPITPGAVVGTGTIELMGGGTFGGALVNSNGVKTAVIVRSETSTGEIIFEADVYATKLIEAQFYLDSETLTLWYSISGGANSSAVLYEWVV